VAGEVCRTTVAPGGHMVGIHLGKHVDALAVGNGLAGTRLIDPQIQLQRVM